MEFLLGGGGQGACPCQTRCGIWDKRNPIVCGLEKYAPLDWGYYSADTPSGETLNLLDPMHGYPARSMACPSQAFALRKPLEKDTSKSSFGMEPRIRCQCLFFHLLVITVVCPGIVAVVIMVSPLPILTRGTETTRRVETRSWGAGGGGLPGGVLVRSVCIRGYH
jgi:hypothetical protein